MTYSQPTAGASVVVHAPIWPLCLAPLVAAVYYLALKFAFAQSMSSIVGGTSGEFAFRSWGTHWIYRLFAEAASLAFGTFVAAGMAHKREKLAGIIGGLVISLFYAVRLSILLFAYMYYESADYSLKESYSQYIVDGVVLAAAPLIGAAVSDIAAQMHSQEPNGFAGINRWHFLWLWLPTYFYGVFLLSPLIQLWFGQGGASRIGDVLHTIAFGVPVLALVVPMVWGLFLLSGYSGHRMSSAVRNLAGIAVIAFGWGLGVLLQFGWASLLTAIFG